MNFFDNISGFLFHPYNHCKAVISEENASFGFIKSLLLVIYSSLIIGVVLCFWALYPERLYYGVPLDAELKMLFRISVSEPTIFMILIGLAFFLVFILNFAISGSANYLISRILSRRTPSSGYKKYLSIYGYSSILPLLLFGTFTIFWVYFVEKFNFTTELAPFFDLTLLNIIFFTVFFGFLAWKWVAETRVNQAFFDISMMRAIIPELVQIAMFIGFLQIVGYIGSIFAGTLITV